MATATKSGQSLSFTYNADGLRTKRTNGTTTYNYVYNGSSLSQMTVGNDVLYFAYDASGSPMSVTYGDATYYYVTNLQGDVVAILDSNGNTVVQYIYDAWGRLLSEEPAANSLGNLNPLRYRGYVYDQETGLYYLQSRYYNPTLGRFISADDPAYLGADGSIPSYNLFAYVTSRAATVGNSFNTDSHGASTGICLPAMPPVLNNGSMIYGVYSSLSSAWNTANYFLLGKNITAFSDDMLMLGVSRARGIAAFNGLWQVTGVDKAFLGVNAFLDAYNSIYHGVSPGGVLLGAGLTLGKDIMLLYANKGIVYGLTALGSLAGPAGTAVGYIAGVAISLVVDYFIGNFLDYVIDQIAK